MDWTLCILYQQHTSEALRCPLNALRCPLNARTEELCEPYKSFLENVNAFRELNKLPIPLCFGEDITVDHLVRHRAQWHKSCRTKFNLNKLDRVQKRPVMQIRNGVDNANPRTRARAYFAESLVRIFTSS